MKAVKRKGIARTEGDEVCVCACTHTFLSYILDLTEDFVLACKYVRSLLLFPYFTLLFPPFYISPLHPLLTISFPGSFFFSSASASSNTPFPCNLLLVRLQHLSAVHMLPPTLLRCTHTLPRCYQRTKHSCYWGGTCSQDSVTA